MFMDNFFKSFLASKVVAEAWLFDHLAKYLPIPRTISILRSSLMLNIKVV